MVDVHALARVLDIPKEDEATAVDDARGYFLYELIREHGLRRTLEIGFAYGKSGAYIMSATRSRHVAIDPWQASFDDRGLKNIEKLGLGAELVLHRDYSHAVLPALLKAGERFDFVFIDGDHKFDSIFVDFYYADLLLERGGFIVLDDTWMRSTSLVASFVASNRRDYRQHAAAAQNVAVFQKVGTDHRDWAHFREFYTTRTLMSFRYERWKLRRTRS